jgi:hypothetical protein
VTATTEVCTCHGAATVLDPPRCPVNGHRQPVDGVPPRQTREQRPSKWLAELRNRRRARLIGRWTNVQDKTSSDEETG